MIKKLLLCFFLFISAIINAQEHAKNGGDFVRHKVIIVGGGPVGLSAAISLAYQGIESILIEKHPSTTHHPKARGVNEEQAYRNSMEDSRYQNMGRNDKLPYTLPIHI